MSSPAHEKPDDPGPDVHGTQQARKPSRLKRYLDKMGLSVPVLIIMIKGSLPPTINIAIYQSTAISSYNSTLGYLIPIISVLSIPILPRAKFLQLFALHLLAMCIGAAVSLLAIWSSVKARENTSTPLPIQTPLLPPPYNASQSAVLGVWLFFNIWAGNFLRAALPSFTLPVVIYSIFISISCTTGTLIPTTERAEALVKQILCVMLLGLGLSAGVSLLIFPVTSRMVVMAELKGIVSLLQKAGKAEKDFLETFLRTHGMGHVHGSQDSMSGPSTPTDTNGLPPGGPALTRDEIVAGEQAAVESLNKTTRAIRDLTAKTRGDVVFAKRDMAWGHLDATDLSETFSLICNVMIPIVAMSRIIDAVSKQTARHRDASTTLNLGEGPQHTPQEEHEAQIFNDIVKQFHEPFDSLGMAIRQGLEHASICLQIIPRPKRDKKAGSSASDLDIEAHAAELRPGDRAFGKHSVETIQRAFEQHDSILQEWARELNTREVGEDTLMRSRALRAQSYLILYIEPLMRAAGDAVRILVDFADSKVEDGTMSRKRFVWGSRHLFRKWAASIFRNEKADASQGPDMTELDDIYYYGGSFSPQMDPEHLPPTNIWERMGGGLIAISRALGSAESGFGLRVACATMTVAILAYLERTQSFFLDQRLIWGMITISLWMTTTSGQSVFGLFMKVGGTLLGMVFSLIIWYIVDEKTPGVIVFLWLFIFAEYYFFKFPRVVPAALLTIVTQIIIIGYELQVKQIGEAIATTTGQPFYPTYLLGPYRLAVVVGGSLVAFFWTIFPSPLTDRTWLRQNLATTLYVLGNYFSATISTFETRLAESEGISDSKLTPATHHLSAARRKTFEKIIRLVSSVESHIQWQRWEPAIGGRFPSSTYEEITLRSTRVMGWISLMSYALTRPRRNLKIHGKETAGEAGEHGTTDGTSEKKNALDLGQVKETHRAVLSVLGSLSSSLLSGRRLPPLTAVYRPKGTLWRPRLLLDDSIPDEAEAKGIASQHGEGADKAGDMLIRRRRDITLNGFFVTELCIDLICDDLDGLTRAVRSLVGEVDFTVRAGGGGGQSGKGAVKQSEGDGSDGVRRRR